MTYPGNRIATIEELISDQAVQLLMAADGVTEADLRGVLAGKRLEIGDISRRRSPSPDPRGPPSWLSSVSACAGSRMRGTWTYDQSD